MACWLLLLAKTRTARAMIPTSGHLVACEDGSRARILRDAHLLAVQEGDPHTFGFCTVYDDLYVALDDAARMHAPHPIQVQVDESALGDLQVLLLFGGRLADLLLSSTGRARDPSHGCRRNLS